MKLKRLELQGFKSFMEKTQIVFNQGITGIVGPNGSGKSNIGDAVRWVLGEQSARMLRGAKMEDVIFNGTQKRKRASFCEVSLVFDNEDHALKSTFSEVAVTRRVFRNGDSEYYLNKSACRLKDIAELFRDTGIGRDGYSLIGQGRIDEILSQKSEDRRQVFEEAAGIMTYRVRKEEAERKLTRTGDNLTRVYDILNELENRLGPLGEQAEVAREYQALSGRLKTLEINIFLLRYDKVAARVEALKSAMEGLTDALMNHEARLNEINFEREALDADINRLEEQLAAARALEGEQNERCHEAELKRNGLESKLQALRDAQAQTREQQAEIAARQETLEALDREGGAAQSAHEAALKQAQDALNGTQEALLAATRDAADKEAALNVHRADILTTVNRLSDARDRQTRQQAVLAQMRARIEEVSASAVTLETQSYTLKAQVDAAQKSSDEVAAHFATLTQNANAAQEQLSQKTQDAQALSTRAQSLNLSLQANLSRLKLMEEMARGMEGYQQAVKRALSYAGDDARVRGVLARLITVPKDMETAIDMVLGGALQNIVTQDEDAAKRIIEYLRQNRLGRATFLPMTSVRSRTLSREERQLLTMPGCLGVASELIAYKEEYRGIVENLLGRTVVADTLKNGIPIMRAGRHAFRLVTLEGDVMHSGGSMTGGTAQGRAVSLLGREREMKELREEIAKKRAALSDLENQMHAATECITTLRREQEQALSAVHQEEIAVAREQEHVKNAQSELAAHMERLSRTLDAKEQLAQSIAGIEQDLKEAVALTQNVTVDRKAMEDKTSALQNALLKARESADALREKFQAEQLLFAQKEHALDTLRHDQSRRAQELTSAKNSLSALQKQALSQEEEKDVLEAALSATTRELEALKASHAKKSTLVTDLEGERLSKAALQRECVKLSDETHKRYDEDSSKQHRTELALTKAQGELNAMCEHILNTYALTYAGALELREEAPFDLSAGEKEAASLKARVRAMGVVNTAAIEDYATEKARYDELSHQREDLLTAKKDLETLIERLVKQMERVFVGEFQKLGEYFSVTFERLFGGGQAALKLADESDPLNCGIDITAQPPGKKLQLLSLLSGGERALTAIAILFAMLKLKPTPFCILDEIEAALDEANISYFADYLAEYKDTTQFVVVTHRKGTMERCDALYGVAMEERGVSRMVSVNLEDYQN